MLSLDFAETAIIEIIATARIMAAIVPNSGITKDAYYFNLFSASWEHDCYFVSNNFYIQVHHILLHQLIP